MFVDQILQLDDLPAMPEFQQYCLCDFNPLSGQRKRRTIHNPNHSMRIVHKRLLAWLRSLALSLPSVTGARLKCSPLRNVERHLSARYFYLLDIDDAYGNVGARSLARVLCELDSRLWDTDYQVEQALYPYFLESSWEGLRTGGPASPDLYNLYAGKLLDPVLQDLAKRYDLTYTRYIDDMTFSSPEQPIGKRKRREICQAIRAAGFPLNESKVQVVDLMKRSIVITGIGLKQGGRIFLPRSYLRKLRGLLHRAIRTGMILPQQVHGKMNTFRAIAKWLRNNRFVLNHSERKVEALYRRFQIMYSRQ